LKNACQLAVIFALAEPGAAAEAGAAGELLAFGVVVPLLLHPTRATASAELTAIIQLNLWYRIAPAPLFTAL
jgi:hypothetical protein